MNELITKSRKVTMKEETLEILSRRDVIAKTSDLFGIGRCYGNKQVLRCCKTAKELWKDRYPFFVCNTCDLQNEGCVCVEPWKRFLF